MHNCTMTCCPPLYTVSVRTTYLNSYIYPLPPILHYSWLNVWWSQELFQPTFSIIKMMNVSMFYSADYMNKKKVWCPLVIIFWQIPIGWDLVTNFTSKLGNKCFIQHLLSWLGKTVKSFSIFFSFIELNHYYKGAWLLTPIPPSYMVVPKSNIANTHSFKKPMNPNVNNTRVRPDDTCHKKVTTK